MNRDARASQCGLIEHNHGKKEIVVAGGIFTAGSVIYDIDNDSWRTGPTLPKVIFHATTVPVGNTFLIVADVILKYDVGNNNWVQLTQTMLTPRRKYFSAFWVPDNYFCASDN